MTAATQPRWRAQFPRMVDLLPDGLAHGRARVRHHTISRLEAMQAVMGGQYTEAGQQIALLEVQDRHNPDHWRMWMSDSYFEHNTNIEALLGCRGHVLIAGLGLGMVVQALATKPGVTSIHVVEQDPDVVALIQPTLPTSVPVTVEVADIFQWQPPKGRRWNSVWLDIWLHVCTDDLAQHRTLRQAARRWRTKQGWTGSWCWDELRYRARQGG